MRIWTIHPQYLDRQGLLAVWREGLLAQAVLLGKTKGYVHHPQLNRFREQCSPQSAIATYLEAIHKESLQRGYHFDSSRIQKLKMAERISETQGQLLYEWAHLLSKLQRRSPEHYERFKCIVDPMPHPLFKVVPGEIRDWEKI